MGATRTDLSGYIGVSAGKTRTSLLVGNSTRAVQVESYAHDEKGLFNCLRAAVHRLDGSAKAIGIAVGASFVRLNAQGALGIAKDASGFAYLGGRTRGEVEAELAREIGVPVAICHDGFAEALAEGQLGAARDCQASFVTVSTGTSPGLGLGLRVSGVVGHAFEGPYSPQPSHLEFNGRTWRDLVGRNARGELARELDLPDDIAEIAAQLDAGEQSAQRYLSIYAERLALGVAYVASIFPVDRVVLVGGVANVLGQRLAETVHDALRRYPYVENSLGFLSVVASSLHECTALGAQLFAYGRAGARLQHSGLSDGGDDATK